MVPASKERVNMVIQQEDNLLTFDVVWSWFELLVRIFHLLVEILHNEQSSSMFLVPLKFLNSDFSPLFSKKLFFKQRILKW